jgi:hypothetical protein
MLAALVSVFIVFTRPTLPPVPHTESAAAVCARSRDGNVQHWQEHRDDGTVRWQAHWSGDDCTIDFRATGEPKFNADFTDVTQITDGGTLDIVAILGSHVRKLTIRADGSRSLAVDGHPQPWDDAARKWLADLLIDLDRVSGIGVDYRLPALLSHGGVPAVLAETEQMGSDYVRSLYLRRLIDRQRLSDEEYQRIVVAAARDVRSDYEMSRILRAVAEHASLENEAMRRAYLDAVDHMSSDYERSRILQTVFAKTRLSHDLARAAVRSAATFKSDYERSRVLLAAIANKSLDDVDALPVLEAVTNSKSDYEKSRVMLAVASRWTLDAEARRAYLRAADTIKSDYENRRVLAALVR